MSGWLQLFYRGTDNGVWTRSRTPDGTWSDEAVLGGFLNGAPVAAPIPGTSTLQLFYVGGDNALWTRWSDPGTYWSDEVRMGGFLTSDPVAAAIPGTKSVQLSYRGSDNAVWTRWRDDSGTWSDEVRMGGVLTSGPVAAASYPVSDILMVGRISTSGFARPRIRHPGNEATRNPTHPGAPEFLAAPNR